MLEITLAIVSVPNLVGPPGPGSTGGLATEAGTCEATATADATGPTDASMGGYSAKDRS